jgi:hypothetical protein
MEQQSLQEHIAWLETQLQQKKQELAGQGGPDKNERELVKEVIQGVGVENIPPPPPVILPPSSAPIASPIKPLPNDPTEEQHKEIVQQLVEKAISEDLFAALKAAENLRNPHLLDEFHDALADHYYEKLVESRKLKIDQ